MAGTATTCARVRVGILICAGALVGSPFAIADSPRTAPAAAPPLSAVAIRHLDQQLADLGRPAFVDGLAGLLLVHAGGKPAVAGAMARRVLARAPTARSEVARALRLAGFAPGVAGLGDGPGGQDAVPPGAAESADVEAAENADVPAAVGAALRDGRPGWRAAGPRSPAGARASAGGSAAFLAPMSTPVPTSAAATLRPGPAGLATPQVR